MILIILGVACLVTSGVLLYKLVPRPGAPAVVESKESALALSQFTLMILGLALIAKGLL